MLILAILPLLSAAATPSPTIQPLDRARDGLVQCYQPNDEAKTCQSIARYERNDDGSWDNTAIVLLNPTQPITLETVTPVWLKDGTVCGYIRNEDILHGLLRISGQLVSDEKAAPILAAVASSLAPLMNKEICTDYVQGPTELIAKSRIEGGSPEVPDQIVKWVSPSEGYEVAPPSTKSAVGV